MIDSINLRPRDRVLSTKPKQFQQTNDFLLGTNEHHACPCYQLPQSSAVTMPDLGVMEFNMSTVTVAFLINYREASSRESENSLKVRGKFGV